MPEHKSYKDESRKNYGRRTSSGLTDDELRIGCLQRIADATETMALNHQKLVDERDRYYR